MSWVQLGSLKRHRASIAKQLEDSPEIGVDGWGIVNRLSRKAVTATNNLDGAGWLLQGW